jgi:acyl carrier protein
MTERVLRKVLELAAGLTRRDVTALDPKMKLFVDLGLDSAGALELVVELEDAFDIQISHKDAGELQTLAEVAALVRRLTGKRPRRRRTRR